jgi:hypothetical protein|uniref:hypothetical protein n=1 Tax=Eubacterium cellulosolvens TaxID=29322 RepID=UPI0004868192|nr:hypothetical protein [[Eubacterium] cellulosolvens]
MYTLQAKIIMDAAAACGAFRKKRNKYLLDTTDGPKWIPEKEAYHQFRKDEEGQKAVIARLRELRAMPRIPDLGAMYEHNALQHREFRILVEELPDRTAFLHGLGREEANVFLFKCRTLANVRAKMKGKTSFQLENCQLVLEDDAVRLRI